MKFLPLNIDFSSPILDPLASRRLAHAAWFLWSGEVRGSQGKSGKIQTVRGSQGIQKYHGAKVNKDAEKNRTVARTLHTAVQNFFCSLRSQIL